MMDGLPRTALVEQEAQDLAEVQERLEAGDHRRHGQGRQVPALPPQPQPSPDLEAIEEEKIGHKEAQEAQE